MKKMVIIAIVVIISSLGIATISSMMSIANAARHSENTCGLDGQSNQATSNGRALGEGTSSSAHFFNSQGSSEGKDVSNLAKQSC
jgi:hypothetical protein